MSAGLRFAGRMDSIQLESSLKAGLLLCRETTCLVSALSFVRLFQLSEMRGVTVYIFDVVSVGDLPIAR